MNIVYIVCFYISMNVKEFNTALFKSVSIHLSNDGIGGNGIEGNGMSGNGEVSLETLGIDLQNLL